MFYFFLIALIYGIYKMVSSATNCQGIVREIHSVWKVVTLLLFLIFRSS